MCAAAFGSTTLGFKVCMTCDQYSGYPGFLLNVLGLQVMLAWFKLELECLNLIMSRPANYIDIGDWSRYKSDQNIDLIAQHCTDNRGVLLCQVRQYTALRPLLLVLKAAVRERRRRFSCRRAFLVCPHSYDRSSPQGTLEVRLVSHTL